MGVKGGGGEEPGVLGMAVVDDQVTPTIDFILIVYVCMVQITEANIFTRAEEPQCLGFKPC